MTDRDHLCTSICKVASALEEVGPIKLLNCDYERTPRVSISNNYNTQIEFSSHRDAQHSFTTAPEANGSYLDFSISFS